MLRGVDMKGPPAMKTSTRGALMLCAVIFTGLAAFGIGCLGSGMDGSLGVNISDQPGWGPTGYDHAENYYIPDIDSYYSVSEHQYIYRDGSNWKHSAALPSSYSTYDPYHSYKVVVNENNPYQNNTAHQAKYGSFKGVKDQPVIRDSKDSKYFVNKDNHEHENWAKEHNH
jgi:hypothetical protein